MALSHEEFDGTSCKTRIRQLININKLHPIKEVSTIITMFYPGIPCHNFYIHVATFLKILAVRRNWSQNSNNTFDTKRV